MSSDDYVIGYGKPPKESQFKPGQSGNVEGRPRKKELYATTMEVVRQQLIDAMEQEVAVTMNGKTRKMRAVVALYNQLLAKGIKGDVRAAKLAIELYHTCVKNDQDQREELLKLLVERDRDRGMTYEESVSKYVAGDWHAGRPRKVDVDPLS